ncbi:MAG: anti-sigma factor domain-containing protein [bacterium]|nr:anti-sigma factor domain-containing protein [bacterium]
MAKRGLVLQWEDGRAIVLAPTGEFISVKTGKKEIGQRISLPNSAAVYWRLATAAVFILVLMGGLFFENYAMAYINIDVNPSFEIALNWRQNVVGVRSLTEDGNSLALLKDFRNLSAEDIARNIAKEYSLLFTGGEEALVVVTASGLGNVDALQERVRLSLEKTFNEKKINNFTFAVTVPGKLRTDAAKLGVSPGQYALALKATEQGLIVTAEDIKQKGLKAALEEVGLNTRKIGSEAAAEKNFGQVKQEIKEKVKGKGPAPK